MERIRIHAVAIAALFGLVAPDAHSATFSWSQVQLTSATGVPADAKHGYAFKGIVQGVGTKKTSDVSFNLDTTPLEFSSTSTSVVFATIWIEGKGRWDEQTKEAEETFLLSGDVKGKFASRLKCTQDPWLGPSSCVVLSAQQVVEKGPLYDWPGMVQKAKLPLSAKTVDPTLAAELSKKAGASSPPPPPPAPKVASKTLNKPGADGPSALQVGALGALAAAGAGSSQPSPHAAVGQQGFPKMERSAPASATPNWGAMGAQAPQGSPPASVVGGAVRTPQSVAPTPSASTMTVAKAQIRPTQASEKLERELVSASCTRSDAGGLRFNCATRAGFDRCESMRQQRQVEHCALAPVR